MGNIIEYDTVSNLSWNVDLRTHAIAKVIEELLAKPWDPAEESGREVPALKRQGDCLVCRSIVPDNSVKPTIAGLFQMGFWKLHPMTDQN